VVGKPFWVERRGEELHAVDQPWARTREEGAGVDGDERLDPGQLGPL
jgi:hypothetical protein